jgi:aspartyl-tRNA(Asn)/glutamyl-tRNA(Gln) amidotransferase subunit A
MSGAANPIISAGITGLYDLYTQRAVTPIEAIEAFIARSERLNPGLNALVHDDFARARKDAAASAKRWAAGKPKSVLDGAPIGVKANIAVAGLPWTAGLPGWDDRRAGMDGKVVEMLRAKGAIILGALNMHEAALGATTDGPLYGKAFNPLRAGFTPGGSSGGSGAAVAAGLCAGALGSDTMGSVRLPAAYCGGFGLKPSFGRVSRAGVRYLSWSLDHVGFHARSAGDLGALLSACTGHDPGDAHSLAFAKPGKPPMLAGARIGRLRFADHVSVEPEVALRFDEMYARLVAAGASLADVAAPAEWFGGARKAGLLLCEAEGAVALADLRGHPGAMSEGLARLLDYGAQQSAAKLAAAQRALLDVREQVGGAFARLDALILPTAPHVAFPHSQAAPATQADLTAFANAAGCPAVTMPMGPGRDGLPTSLQIVTAPGRDEWAIALAGEIAALN